jgi:flagellar protein FlbD
MIKLSRLNGSDLWLNPLLIEFMESTPDSIVTMTNGHKYIVRDTPDEIVHRITQFLREVGNLSVAGRGDGA